MFYSCIPCCSSNKEDWPLIWVVETVCLAYFREYHGASAWCDFVAVWRMLKKWGRAYGRREFNDPIQRQKVWCWVVETVLSLREMEVGIESGVIRPVGCKLKECIDGSMSFRKFLLSEAANGIKNVFEQA